MSFSVYDYRTTNRNVLVTPEIRARLYHMAPGQVDRRHSHDLGHEVFLILEGEAEFTIEGQTEVLGSGQMCIARADEIHQVRNLLPDKPTIMYLSVTPHIQPTHTGRNEDGSRQPPRFQPNQQYDSDIGDDRPLSEVLADHLQETAKLAETAQSFADVQSEMAERWRRAVAEGDLETAVEARNAMSDAVYRLHRQLYAVSSTWNELAPQANVE